MKYLSLAKTSLMITALASLGFASSAHADSVSHGGKIANVHKCVTGQPSGDVIVTDIHGNQTTYPSYNGSNSYKCHNIVAPGAENAVLADQELPEFDQPINQETGNLTFDEALSVCRQTRGVDLQACVDKKSGQRIKATLPPVNHNTYRANKQRN